MNTVGGEPGVGAVSHTGQSGISPGPANDAGETIRIDCFDLRWHLPEYHVVDAAGRSFRFVYDDRLKTGARFDHALFFDECAMSKHRFRYPRSFRCAVLKESPLSARGDEVFLRREYPVTFTFRRALLERGRTFVELAYGTNWLGLDAMAGGDAPAKERMVSFMGSLEHSGEYPGYVFRREVAKRLQERGGIDCYGKGVRPVSSKSDALAPYRFSVCMENVCEDYYFTEKIVDCILMNTIPIYWGCPGIDRYLDPRGLLRFTTIGELEGILDSLSLRQYESMLPWLVANRQTLVDADLHSFEGFHRRLAAHLTVRMPLKSLPPWRRSTSLAMVRRLVALGGHRRATQAP